MFVAPAVLTLHSHSLVGVCNLSVDDGISAWVHCPHHPTHCVWEKKQHTHKEPITKTEYQNSKNRCTSLY